MKYLLTTGGSARQTSYPSTPGAKQTYAPAVQAQGKKCKLTFRLGPDDPLVPSMKPGGQTVIHVYRLEANCLNDDYTWANRPARGVYAGRIYAFKNGWTAEGTIKESGWAANDVSADTWQPKMTGWGVDGGREWDCEAGEYGFEMVMGDEGNVGWETGRNGYSGLRLEVY
ncbi:hypothetical protein QBC35DRAFT_467861 [Podospora australis]|uniref:Ubiquitin 3 binding protein But2 C-terminal domain-containing protein n=1 Tax=Podospora australis TaxID=1536484 RepID=A0AAN7AEC9_9PEZI|nr:hypothetical protein QBC35DRAFT_467861 [Podospora australis]